MPDGEKRHGSDVRSHGALPDCHRSGHALAVGSRDRKGVTMALGAAEAHEDVAELSSKINNLDRVFNRAFSQGCGYLAMSSDPSTGRSVTVAARQIPPRAEASRL